MVEDSESSGLQPFTKKFGEPLYSSNNNNNKSIPKSFEYDDDSDSDTIEEEDNNENIDSDNVDPFLLDNSDILPLNSPPDTVNTLKALKNHIATSESRSFTNLERQLLATIVQHGILNKNVKDKPINVDDSRPHKRSHHNTVSGGFEKFAKFEDDINENKTKINLDVQKKLNRKLKPKIDRRLSHKSYHPDDKPTLELLENVMEKKDDRPAYEDLLSSFLSTKKSDRHSYKEQNYAFGENKKYHNYHNNNERFKQYPQNKRYSANYDYMQTSKRFRVPSSSETRDVRNECSNENNVFRKNTNLRNDTQNTSNQPFTIENNDRFSNVSHTAKRKNTKSAYQSTEALEKLNDRKDNIQVKIAKRIEAHEGNSIITNSLTSDSKIPISSDKEDGEL